MAKRDVLRSLGRYPEYMDEALQAEKCMYETLKLIAAPDYHSAVWIVEAMKQLMNDFHFIRLADLCYLSFRMEDKNGCWSKTSEAFYYGWDMPEEIERAEIVQNGEWWEIHMPYPCALPVSAMQLHRSERSDGHAE